MVDIQSPTDEIRRGKKEERKKQQGKNIMACPITYGGHKKHFAKWVRWRVVLCSGKVPQSHS